MDIVNEISRSGIFILLKGGRVMMTGRLKTCLGVMLGGALVLFYALPCSADGSADIGDMQQELRALKAEVESLRADLNNGKGEMQVQNDELLASKKEYSQLSEQVRGLRQANTQGTETLKDQIKKELGIVPNVYNDMARKIRVGMNLRTRGEFANGFAQITDVIGQQGWRSGGTIFPNFGKPANSQTIVLSRVRLNIDADVHEHLRAFLQLQDSRYWGIEGNTGGTAARMGGASSLSGVGVGQITTDIHQAYVDVRKLFDYPATLRLGRQEIIWGDHRMMGSFGWHNISNSFNAIRGFYDTENYAFQTIGSVLAHDPRTSRYTAVGSVVPNRAMKSNDVQNYGAMFTIKRLIPDATLELMVLHNNNQLGGAANTQANSGGNRQIWDGGLRIAGKVGKPFDYSGEFHGQGGEYQNQDHSAFAGYVAAGYTLHNVAWKPRFGLEGDWSPGDDDGRSGDHETFYNFYPTNHKHYGYMDQMAWMNMRAVRGQIKVKPTKKMVAWADIWGFWLDDTDDNWYNAGQATMRGYSTNGLVNQNPSSHLGTELDLTLKYKLYKNVALQTGYSHFFSGDYIEETALTNSDPSTQGVRQSNSGADSDWGYMQMVVGF